MDIELDDLRRRGVLLGLALTLLSASISCAAPAESEPGPSDVTIELDAYSGRPNPTWKLTPAEAEQLAGRLRGMPELSEASPPEAVLGYRGFRVANPGGDGGIPERIYVARGGMVQVFDGDERWRGYGDHAGIESWLIEAARRRGHGEVFP